MKYLLLTFCVLSFSTMVIDAQSTEPETIKTPRVNFKKDTEKTQDFVRAKLTTTFNNTTGNQSEQVTSNKPETHYLGMKLSDFLMALFTFFVALFTLGLAWIAVRQNRYFSAVERAYVFAEFSSAFSTKEHVYVSGAFKEISTANEDLKAIIIGMTLINTGKTPAQKVTHKYCVGLVDGQNIITNLEEFSKIQCRGFTQKTSGLIIKGDGKYIEDFPEYGVDDITWRDITKYRRTLHVAGIIEYEDVFKITRRTVYDWKYSWNGHRGDFIQSENVKLNNYT